MSWLNGKCREVSSPVDRDTLSQDGVQTLHLLPRQNTTAPALLRHIRGGHGEISPVKTQVCSMDVSWMPRLCDVRRVRFKVERQFKIKAWIWKVILSTKQNPNICLWTNELRSLFPTVAVLTQSTVHSLCLLGINLQIHLNLPYLHTPLNWSALWIIKSFIRTKDLCTPTSIRHNNPLRSLVVGGACDVLEHVFSLW